MAKKIPTKKRDSKQVESKIEIEKESQSSIQKNSDKRDRQAILLLGIFLGLILIFILVFVFIRGSNNFTLHGVQFNKHNENSVVFYTAKVPISDSKGTIVDYTSVDFRNDPRKLKNIPIQTSGIRFVRGKTVYLAYGDIKICENNGLAAVNINRFLNQFGITNRTGALSNLTYAKETNITYADCNTNPDNTVFLITNGDKTQINQTSNNCYKVISKDCEILQATERLQLEILNEYVDSLK